MNLNNYLTFEEVLGIILNNLDANKLSQKDVAYFDFNYNETINNSGKQIVINSLNQSSVIYTIANSLGVSNVPWIVDSDLTTNVKKLLDTLFIKYSDAYILKYNECDLEHKEHNITLFSQKVWKFIERFIQKITNTYDKYSKILDLYESEKNNLLKGVSYNYSDQVYESSNGSTSGENRFNDTPQDTGTFSDDTHTSSLSENSTSASSSSSRTLTHTSTNDRDTVMERLDKVQENYQLVIEKWAREFRDFFYLPVNLEV